MTSPAENFQCFGVVFDTNNVATCRCPSDRCVASVDGLRLGRVSSISDINCRACQTMTLADNNPLRPDDGGGFQLNADATHRTETFGPIDPTAFETLTLVPIETDPHGIDAHTPGAKLDAGKVRPGLVLGNFARALLAVSAVGTYGAAKYSDNGWVSVPNGIDRYDDAKMRHWLKDKIGEQVDPDTMLSHAAHEAWNALARLDLLIREQEKVKV